MGQMMIALRPNRFPGPLLRFLVLIALLQGCSGMRDTTAQKGETFDGESAFIVISLRTTDPYPPGIALTWREFDPDIGFLKDSPSHRIEVTRSNANWTLSETSRNQQVEYQVYEVNPGTFGAERHIIQGAKRYIGKLRPNTVVFSVERGEVAYIGNFLLHVPIIGTTKSLPGGTEENYRLDKTKLKLDGRNDAAAKAFLDKTYPAIADAFVAKKVEFVPMTLR